MLLAPINRPYVTMANVANQGNLWPAFWLIGVVSNVVMGVFALLASIKGANPLGSLSLQVSSTLASGLTAAIFTVIVVMGTYAAAAAAVALVCSSVGGNGNLRRHAAAWALTYPPTILAFAAVLAMHALADVTGPGTGWLFTAFFALLVLALLWKLVLYFTYLRVVGELTFIQMLPVSAILLVVVLAYEWALVSLGLGKVPFI